MSTVKKPKRINGVLREDGFWYGRCDKCGHPFNWYALEGKCFECGYDVFTTGYAAKGAMLIGDERSER